MSSEISQEDLRKLLMSGPRHAHLVGVSGSGMSGVARLLVQRGHTVSGSDLGGDVEGLILESMGVKRFRGHASGHVGNAHFVCYSSAIPMDNPELVEARHRGIPCVRRARTLAALIPPQQAIVISGTHGKTTTTSMIAYILRRAGDDCSFFIGAQVPDLGGSAGSGKGQQFVVEADESDGTMNEFQPHDLVILNVESEHLDFYENLEAIERGFAALAASATGRVIYVADDSGASRVVSGLPCASGCSIHDKTMNARWRAREIVTKEGRLHFRVEDEGRDLGSVTLRIPGKHNISNALTALAVTLGLGVKFDVAAAALSEFSGARRRFDRLFESRRFLVVDDYAHHPSEVHATIEAARQIGRKRVVAVFQPHRYTRTRALYRDFGVALAQADRVFVTDVYAASEMPIKGVDGRLVADAVPTEGRAEASVIYESDLWRLREKVGGEMQEGDLTLVMGAGDIQLVSRRLADETRVFEEIRQRAGPFSVIRRYEPMSKHTSMRTGGPASLWVEPAGEVELGNIVKHCYMERKRSRREASVERLYQVTFIGRGSNLLVRDSGISGVTIHLSAEPFTRIQIDGTKIVVGGGTRLKSLVMAARKAGLGGLEFLEGIPGSVGGALWMNAGAMGKSIFDVVESVRVMDMSGVVSEKQPLALDVSYRSCKGLHGHVVLAATLKAMSTDLGSIDAKLREFERKRWDSQPAAASSGCIFKNPAHEATGRIIDEMGLKGLSFGGAKVSNVHGNFIVNEGGATTSDILSLISIIQERVRKERGLDLQMEVVVIGDEQW